MKSPNLKRVTIDETVADTPIARRYASYAREVGAPVREMSTEGDAVHRGHTLGSGKREVVVEAFRGAAVKQCTGLESSYVCCNLHVMNQTTNCPLDCSYCILQAYINRPVTTVYANLDEMLRQVEQQVARQPGRLFRIGTGDLGDALALDPLGGVTRDLVPRFAAIENAVLELKTKSDAVDQLIGLKHGGRVVVAWSINPTAVIEAEEHRCASLAERLEAAQRVVEDGYLVAFHFDPMIVHDGWETGYPELVEAIFDAVSADRVAWVSIGSLRFPPSMKKTMLERFPRSRLTLGEMLLAADGKMRYLKPLRLQMYSTLYAALQAGPARDVFSYLCMEPPEVWRRVLAMVPQSNNHLDYAFSRSVVARFPHLMSSPLQWRDYEHASNLGGTNRAAPGVH